MNLVCLDLEGVLIPEIWINVAKKTGIEELMLTTREIPNYDKLMNRRLKILKENKLKLSDIQKVIASMDPFEGAYEFQKFIREEAQLIILSDTFEQFASPLMKKLDNPTLFCNTLIIEDDAIVSYKLRQTDGKRKAVEAFQSIGCRVFAFGDSYNDVTMIQKADKGGFFKAPQSILNDFNNYPAYTEYGELKKAIKEFIA